MDIKEKDLEEIIYNTETRLLNKRGLYVTGKCYRQFRVGTYGIADLIFVSREYDYGDYTSEPKPYLLINICELKKEKAGISAFLQGIRYAKGIKRYLDDRCFYDYQIGISLIAPEIDKNSDFIFIESLIKSRVNGSLCFLNNYTVKYNFNGIEFINEKGYKMTGECFKSIRI